MATGTLTGQTIANTYKSLLKITGTTAGGETLHATTLKVIEDGDGNPFPFSAATDAIMITSTNRLEFGDNASYIHQSADGVLDLVSDTEIELTATTIDINGAVDMSSTLTIADAITQGSGVLTIKNATGDGNGLRIFQDSSDASKIYNHYNGTLQLGVGNTTALTIDSSEDATFASWATITEGLIVNESGGDNDVRIESQNQANMFRIDASTDRIGIRESTPLATLHIKEGDSGLSSLNGSGTNLFLEANGANAAGMTIASGNTANGYIIFGDSDSNFRGAIQYDHSSPDKMHLVTAGSQRLSIDQNGRVGIGDSSPGAPLDVKSGEAANTANFNSTNGATNITLESSGSLIGQMEFVSSGTSAIVTRTSASLALGSNNVRTLYITDDDRVGINEDAPITKLDTRLDSTSTDLSNDYAMFINNQTGAVIGRHATIGFGTYNNGGLTNVFGAVAEGVGAQSGFAFLTHNGGALTEKVRIKNGGQVGIGTTTNVGNLSVNSGISSSSSSNVITIHQNTTGDAKPAVGFGVAIGNGGESTNAGDLLISTASGGSLGERMRVTSAGRIGINTTSVNAKLDIREGTNGQEIIYLDHTHATNQTFILFKAESTTRGTIAFNSSSTQTTYNATSDERVKENIKEVDNALSMVNKIPVKKFNFKVDKNKNTVIGYIGQELIKEYPQAVTLMEAEGYDDFHMVDNSKLVPVLMKAVQELSAKVEALENA